MKKDEFFEKLLNKTFHDCYEFQDRNTDFFRFPTSLRDRITRRLKDKFYVLARRKGFVRRHFSIERASQCLSYILRNTHEFEAFYQLLCDDYSRQLLIELLSYRLLGPQHVRLSTNYEEYWRQRAAIDNDFLQERHALKTQSWPGMLNRYQLDGLNGLLNIYSVSMGVLNVFVLEHYAYKRNGKAVGVEPGDVVIDGGGCWGDSALYFADRVGPQGKVYCFEFALQNLNILQHNLDLNQHISDSISVVSKALWDKGGEIVNYYDSGPGTSLEKVYDGPLVQVSTVTIDDFVKGEKVGRVDFIKMDIEGSELKALQGAAETIQVFRPKLAISLYHKKEDFVTIPRYLAGLDVQYEFFLDHFTIHGEETVLFASPESD
ncbi:MAG: FkbM family methyltransferase [Candidatus Hodarchaeota archaeon]